MDLERENLEFCLSGKEICAIISACRVAKVQEFELGALYINFSPRAAKEIAPQENTWANQSYTSVQTQSDTQSTTQNNHQDNEAPDLEDDLLPILDPTQWEENRLKA